jgi:hypothetical protein
MSGFDSLGTEYEEIDDEVGFDYMALATGAAGALSNIASGSKKPGDKADDAAATKEKQRLRDQAAEAEKSAATWKKVGIAIIAILAVGGAIFGIRRVMTPSLPAQRGS